MIIELINTIHKFLGYLNISMKYLNRLYTLLALLPMGYHVRLLYLFYQSRQYSQLVIFTLLLIVFLYFWSINFMYYFFDKNTKYDITQLIAEVVPDEVFDDNASSSTESATLKNVTINRYSRLESIMEELITDKKIETVKIEDNGYIIKKKTLMPYYTLDQLKDEVVVSIGTSYDNLEVIGTAKEMKIEDIDGLFIYGGYFYSEGTQFKDRYYLKIHLKEEAIS